MRGATKSPGELTRSRRRERSCSTQEVCRRGQPYVSYPVSVLGGPQTAGEWSKIEMAECIKKPSIENEGLVSKTPGHKPVTRSLWRIPFTWLMWLLSIYGALERFIRMMKRLVHWLREMSDDS